MTNALASIKATQAVRQRGVPHSQEAEEYLLSCCFIDGNDTVAKCIAGKLTADAFFAPANRLIFETITDLYNGGTIIDLAVVAEELKASRKLEEIGGYAYLTQISNRIPTTAQLGYFIEKLIQLKRCRDLLRSASLAVENIHAEADPELVISQLRADIEAQAGMLPVLNPMERFREHLFSLENPPPPSTPRFFIQEKPVATPGNLVTLIAQAKSGKTALVGAFIASFLAALSDTTPHCDLLGISSIHPGKGVMLHFDTEQSPEDHDAVIRRALRRANTPECQQLHSVRLTTIGIAERLNVIKAFVEFHAKRDGVQAVIIDGVADLAFDVNDLRECSTLVAELHAMAIRANTSIICVIHDNEGKETNGDGRGHLGKQLMRKAESNLRLKKKEAVTVVFSEKMRRAPIFEKDGICFAWDDRAGMHVSTQRPQAPAKGYGRPKEHSFAQFADLIPTDPEKGLGLNALWRAICDVRPISKSVFVDLIKEAEALGLVAINKSNPSKMRYYRPQK